MTTSEWAMVTLAAFWGGVALGGWLKDRQWRAAATIGVRMAMEAEKAVREKRTP